METPLVAPVLPETSLCSEKYQVIQHTGISGTSKILGKKELSDWLEQNGYIDEAWKLAECGLKFGHYVCGCNKDYYYRQDCGREYCPRCGAKDSYYHSRRVMRAAEHFIFAIPWGKLIFTMPKAISESRLEKRYLYMIQKTVWEVAQDNFGMAGALIVLHPIGEPKNGLHVHYEVLFMIQGTFGKAKVPPEVLERTKKAWALKLNEMFNLNLETTNIEYKFKLEKRRKWHMLQYALRPVCTEEAMNQLSDEDKKWILGLKGFHRTKYYGEISNSKLHAFLRKSWAPITVRDIPPLEKKVCPFCKTKMRYIGWCFESDINKMNFVKYSERIYIDRVDALMLRPWHNKEGP